MRVLALNDRGELTYCTCPPELRGKGRCNHIAHQEEGQSTSDFIKTIEQKIKVEDGEMVDITTYTKKLISKYCDVKNPEWPDVIMSIPNPFTIGSKDSDSYEEANLEVIEITDVINPIGDTIKIQLFYSFRGREFACNPFEIPKVNEDGTIMIDGIKWRVLPVLEQNKAGIISYKDNIVVKQEDGRNISFVLPKDPDADYVFIYGKRVPIDVVENFLQTGDSSGLTTAQIWALKSIDPIVYEICEDFKTNLRGLKDLKEDDPADISLRRVIRYEDIVKEQIALQFRRMGVTFRTNLNKRHIANPKNPMSEVLDDKYPLFYQENLTSNIKKALLNRSNVQYADDLNPIAALSQTQKISFTGPGGFHKDKVPYSVRMPHKSHQDVFDSMDISSGKNVGLTATMSYGYIGEDRFIYPIKDRKTLSPSDFIPYKYHNDPNRGIMAVAHLKQACPIIGGEDPIVKTPAWDEIKGAKLGVNLKVAYIPEAGVFEDSVVLSQSAADKMTTIQHKVYNCKEPVRDIQIGQRVERKQVIAGEEIKEGGYISKIGDGFFEVETVYKMTPGDKLAGRHGNKSIVSEIRPDKDMPKILIETPNGPKFESVDIIFSPMSVVGRKNLGQIMETNEAMGYEPTIDKKHKVVLKDGHIIEATAGKQFIMRLNHIAEKKLASHADELNAKRESEGARLGEMEAILLSTDKDRLRVLDYLRHQEAYDSHNKLNNLLKAIGVKLEGVNW